MEIPLRTTDAARETGFYFVWLLVRSTGHFLPRRVRLDITEKMVDKLDSSSRTGNDSFSITLAPVAKVVDGFTWKYC